ncbi:MAG: hypothetical protein HWE30_19235 [Methylocystaceae bacterium]|nr:hypothetical protein [Methylocystaceae bacterium]
MTDTKTENNNGLKIKGNVDGISGEIEISEATLNSLSKPIAEAWGFVEDWLKDRRALQKFERRIRYQERALNILSSAQNKLNVSHKDQYHQPNDRFWEIVIPAISVEEDQTLKELWANLIANTIKNENPNNDEIGHALLLRDMPIGAAHLLDWLWNNELTECRLLYHDIGKLLKESKSPVFHKGFHTLSFKERISEISKLKMELGNYDWKKLNIEAEKEFGKNGVANLYHLIRLGILEDISGTIAKIELSLLARLIGKKKRLKVFKLRQDVERDAIENGNSVVAFTALGRTLRDSVLP